MYRTILIEINLLLAGINNIKLLNIMKKMIAKMAIVFAIAFMAASCGKPEFVKDETWDVWVALNSKVNLSDLRQRAAEDKIQYNIDIIKNNSDLTEDDKNGRLISVTCYYPWLKDINPLDPDGHKLSRWWHNPFAASVIT